MNRRHKWSPTNDGTFKCMTCLLERARPPSAIRRGRLSVSEWVYLIGGEWRRKSNVPPCEPQT